MKYFESEKELVKWCQKAPRKNKVLDSENDILEYIGSDTDLDCAPYEPCNHFFRSENGLVYKLEHFWDDHIQKSVTPPELKTQADKWQALLDGWELKYRDKHGIVTFVRLQNGTPVNSCDMEMGTLPKNCVAVDPDKEVKIDNCFSTFDGAYVEIQGKIYSLTLRDDVK